jgi:hypothetical protein
VRSIGQHLIRAENLTIDEATDRMTDSTEMWRSFGHYVGFAVFLHESRAAVAAS